MQATLKTVSNAKQTLGFFTYGSFSCVTVELPWKDNKQEISCYPAGTYQCRKIVSPTRGKCIEVMNVPNRTNIQIHAANYARQLLGCTAVGATMADIDGDGNLDVTSSKNTLEKLLDAVPDRFTLVVERLL